jgi:hypothetical protein
MTPTKAKAPPLYRKPLADDSDDERLSGHCAAQMHCRSRDQPPETSQEEF